MDFPRGCIVGEAIFMHLRKIAVVVLLLVVALTAFSQQRQEQQYLDGSELLSYCDSGAVTNTRSWCLGYILGVWHTAAPQRQACPPADVTSGQLRQAVVRYLQQNPEKLDRQPGGLVLEAIGKTFPCG
jgi:hypothetical protein